jgi:hypothetical protein
MYLLVLTVMLNLTHYPLWDTPDGQATYMRTTSFRVGIGPHGTGFATKLACQAYAVQDPNTGLYPFEPFTFKFWDENGIEYDFPMTNANGTLVNQTFSVVGCVKVS